MRIGKRASLRRWNLATVVTAAVVAGGVFLSQPAGSLAAQDLGGQSVENPTSSPTTVLVPSATIPPSAAAIEPSSEPSSASTADPTVRDPGVTREFGRPETPQALAPAAKPIELIPPPSFSFEIATHNVLGASHTSGKKGRGGFAGASTRMGYTVGLLNGYGVDVVGLQEFQRTQYDMFRGRMPGFGVYPGLAAGPLGIENSIAWRSSMFELVDSYTISVPYFGGRPRPMPVIRLKERTTEREFWVANFHNPADTHGPAGRWRAAATGIEINLINKLRSETELPVFITGDMNERESYFCRVTASTGIAAASGGGTGSPCQSPPGPVPVDWILATPDAKITEYHDVRTGIITRTSDHGLLVATALMED